jgi:hypothetical protein
MKKFSDIRGTPSKIGSKLPDPPMVVLLQRKAIRLYPNGQRIALYHNDRLNLDVSVPYFPGKFGKELAYGELKEDISLDEDQTIWKKLGAIAKGKPGDVAFPDGTVMKNVQPATAASLKKLRDDLGLNTYNKEKLANKVNLSAADFTDVVNFIKKNDL